MVMKGIYLLLGSNLGDSLQQLKKAQEFIQLQIGSICAQSSIYKTKPWGVEQQADFLNQVLEVDSEYSAEEILEKINEIELKLGRIRFQKWHARAIDIDILYFADHIISSEKLKIPHPENQNRNFVLVPMAEIAPDFIHPILGISQLALLLCCKDQLAVEILT
ncbi:MAG: 2-amino-4-hydroxy-6-hydroxymethyldihydropteridine diphosphokinase [Cyclobacteriaceae bacterium]|nr:2-amino-4-hydroxy-6-hydroxymethyldihydropteridine diphosphokinase [Cyclobacteriaceae bacterium]